jgi:inner membrane protein
MMAGSHMLLGGAAWVAVAPHVGLPPLDPVLLGLAVGGSLLPDVDHPASWVGRRSRPVSTLVAGLFGHRGVTHSLLAVAGCAAVLRWAAVPHWAAAPLVVGYLSHLAADLLTPGGLRLAWPAGGRVCIPLCRTGGLLEPVVVGLCLAGILWGQGASRPLAGAGRARPSFLWMCDPQDGPRIPLQHGK